MIISLHAHARTRTFPRAKTRENSVEPTELNFSWRSGDFLPSCRMKISELIEGTRRYARASSAGPGCEYVGVEPASIKGSLGCRRVEPADRREGAPRVCSHSLKCSMDECGLQLNTLVSRSR